jgi:hypothetical protein
MEVMLGTQEQFSVQRCDDLPQLNLVQLFPDGIARRRESRKGLPQSDAFGTGFPPKASMDGGHNRPVIAPASPA